MVPSVIETETMLHLSTLLEGQVSDPEVCALQVAADLHPLQPYAVSARIGLSSNKRAGRI